MTRKDAITTTIWIPSRRCFSNCSKQSCENPETIATAIRIGNPASWQKAVKALDESNGLIDSVTDEEILEAYQLMTTNEGYLVNQQVMHLLQD